MSAKLRNIYGSIPATTRGKALLIGGDPKGENILYPCGNSIVIRNIKNPLICDYYHEHSYPTTCARYSPSGFYIASADTTGTVRIWDTTQVEHILKIELRPLSGAIWDMSWSEDSKRIVAVGDGREKFGSVFLWDSGSSVGEISGHSKTLYSCDFKKSRPYRIMTGGDDNMCNWFEGPPFKFKKCHQEHTRFVNCVRFSPDGALCCSVSSDKKGLFYDGKTGERKHELSSTDAHKGGIYSCSWSEDSKQLLTSSGDKSAKIWDVETGKCVTTFTMGNQVEDQQLGCIWQGDALVTLSLSGQLNFLDVNNPNKPRQVIYGHNKFITSLAVNSNSGKAYTGAYDASVVSWDLDTCATEIFNGKGHSNQINKLEAVDDTLVSCGKDDSLRFTPLSTKTYSDEKVGLDGEACSFSTHDGKLVVVCSTTSVHVVRDNKSVSSVKTPYGSKAVSLSPNLSEVVVGGQDNSVYVYSLSGNALTQTDKFPEHRAPVTDIAYSPDGKMFASCDTGREVIIWDASTKKRITEGWGFHTARVNSLAWSPDSGHLASAGLDQLIIVYNPTGTPSERITIKNAHRAGVNVVRFLDNNTIASVGQDCSLKTFSLSY